LWWTFPVLGGLCVAIEKKIINVVCEDPRRTEVSDEEAGTIKIGASITLSYAPMKCQEI
jgi:hypothetical protein